MRTSFVGNRHIFGILLITMAIVCGTIDATAQSAVKPLTFDSKKMPKPSGAWTFVHSDNGEVIAAENGLSLAPAVGTNLFLAPDGNFNVVNAPMVLFAPEGDFTFKAKMSAQLQNVYDVGALVVMEDDQHWAKLCFENSARQEATIVSVVTRERSDDSNSETIASPFIYMAIARKGNEFSMHFSRDGVQWRLARHFQLQTSSKLRLGFAAHTVSNPHFAATFSEIVYRASAPKNMRQLEPADVVNQ
jgi:regulation of enolase protein 1 (concanavalin A-like superfamily)